MQSRAFRTIPALPVIALLLAASMHAPAAAQSRYTLSTLKPPFLGKVEANQFIDSQNRVFASVAYYRSAGFVFDNNWRLTWQTFYDPYPAMWSGSSATSLSPSKLLNNKVLNVVGISRKGSKLLMDQPLEPGSPDAATRTASVYDTSSRQALNYIVNGVLGSTLGTRVSVYSVNDQGWVAGAITSTIDDIGRTLTRAARWRPGQAAELLQMPTDAVGSAALSINAAGDVAGEVQQATAGGGTVTRAAVWRLDGSLVLLETPPGAQASAKSIADNGTVLVLQTAPLGNGLADTSLSLHANGQVQALPSVAGDTAGQFFHVVTHDSLSPDGDTVVGVRYLNDFSAPRGSQRAFIYKDGTTHDLTSHASAKGVKLPAGAHLTAAMGINAQGSMAAGYEAAGRFVAVRLTAVP